MKIKTPLALIVSVALIGSNARAETNAVVDINPNPNIFECSLTATQLNVTIQGTNVHALVYKDENGATWPAGHGLPLPVMNLKVGDMVICHFKNTLPAALFPEGASIHWHGIELDNDSDGTAVTQDSILEGQSYVYRFKVTRPGLFWFHSHMVPGNETFAGMYGAIIIPNPVEPALRATNALPPLAATYTLALSDIDFSTNGFVGKYIASSNAWFRINRLALLCHLAAQTGVKNTDACGAAGLPGKKVLVNGMSPDTAPITNNVLSGQRIRLRLLNESISRHFRVKLIRSNGTQINLYRIGGQGGLLNHPVLEGGASKTSTGGSGWNTGYNEGEIVLAAGIRADTLARISGTNGEIIRLVGNPLNTAGGPAYNLSFDLPSDYPIAYFRITGNKTPADPVISESDSLLAGTAEDLDLKSLKTGTPVPLADHGGRPGTNDPVIHLKNTVPFGPGVFLGQDPTIDGFAAELEGNEGNGAWTNVTVPPTTRYAFVGDLLELTVTNETSAVHPFHLHGFSFQPIAVISNGIAYTFDYTEFVDTIDVYNNQALVFRVKLEDREKMCDGAPSFPPGPVLASCAPAASGGAKGRWVYHCHIFSHAGLGMISELDVFDRIDYGNAPPPYPTLLIADGARHFAGSGIQMGTRLDWEFDGPDAGPTIDEDGITWVTPLVPGAMAEVRVAASGPGQIDAFIDFNQNGVWEDPIERIGGGSVATVGASTPIFFTVPPGAIMGSTWARFRLSTGGGLGPTGAAPNGEVEDHPVAIGRFDFGNAPDPNYPTLLLHDGARHLYDAAWHLGGILDSEADGPDGAPLVDEDGVVFLSTLYVGSVAAVQVTASTAGSLDAFVDFNRNGVWEDPSERITAATGTALVAGANTLSFTVPSGSTIGNAWARFRFSSTGGLLSTGPASIGEVEDYLVSIVPGLAPPTIAVHPESATVHVGGTATFKVVATGSAPLAYFWRHGQDFIPGATGSTHTVVAAQQSDAGTYSVLVSNAVATAISAAASLTITSTPPIYFSGLEHAVLGNATLDAVSNELRVSNIGSSGQDGVSINLGEAEGWRASIMAPLNPQTATNGSRLNWDVRGTVSGASNQLVSGGRMEIVNGELTSFADFAPVGASHYLVMARNNGAIVASNVVPAGGAAYKFPGPSAPGPIIIKWQLPIPDDDNPTCSGRWPAPCPIIIDLPNGPLVNADEVVVKPLSATASVSALSRLDFFGGWSNGDLVLRNEAVQKFGLFHILTGAEPWNLTGELGQEGGEILAGNSGNGQSAVATELDHNHALSVQYGGTNGLQLGVGAAVQFRFAGPVGTNVAVFGTLEITDQAVSADFSAVAVSGFLLEVWNGSQFVDSISLSGGTLAFLSSLGGGTLGLVDNEATWTDNQLTPARLKFRSPVMITPTGGAPLVGDVLRITALSTSSVPQLTRVDQLFNSLPDVRFTISMRDYGDAPTTYPVTKAENGASHKYWPNWKLGAKWDREFNGTHSAASDYDDTHGFADELDGVVIVTAAGGIQVQVTSAVNGFLDAWVDLDRNLSWAEAGNRVANAVPLAAGVPQYLNISVPAGTLAGQFYSRWRLSETGGVSYVGFAGKGEVEDVVIHWRPETPLDFGDAPNSYHTYLASTGPSHVITPSEHLGATIDAESDGQPIDLDGADEDGVTFPATLTPGSAQNLAVTASAAGKLDGWIDFNHNGKFDTGPASPEQVCVSVPLAAGPNSVPISIPSGAIAGGTWARFRFSLAGGLGPTDAAPDGEVEDYGTNVVIIGVTNANPVNLQATLASDRQAYTAMDPATFTITVTNTGTNVATGVLLIFTPDPFLDVTNVVSSQGVCTVEDEVRCQVGVLQPGGVCIVSVRGLYGAPIIVEGSAAWDNGNGAQVLPESVSATNRVTLSANEPDMFLPDNQAVAVVGVFQQRDFGDAPPPYPTLLPNGARHGITFTGLYLGARVDAETNGQPTNLDDNGLNDEEGVTFLNPIVPGSNVQVRIVVSTNGKLDAWFDWNRAAAWETNEKVFQDVTLLAGTNDLLLNVPSGIPPGATWARFRVSTAGSLPPDGYASDGEVEDHLVDVVASANNPDLVVDTPESPFNVTENLARNLTLNVTNRGSGAATTVQLTARAPAGLRVLSATNSAGTCQITANSNVVCSVASLASNAAFTVVLSVRPDFLSPQANEFENLNDLSTAVTSAEADLAPANNSLALPIVVHVQTDWGDARGGYPVTAAENGAHHRYAAAGPWLGIRWDNDGAGNHSLLADFDDTHGASDDEDGISFVTALMPGATATVIVTATAPGFLDAWADFNRNLSWADAGDRIFTSQPLVAGSNMLTFVVPPNATPGTNTTRWRLSTTGGLSDIGYGGVGEVEDHMAEIVVPPVVAFAGLTHVSTGNAIVNVSSNQLHISNLGTNGQDGVNIELGRVDGWIATLVHQLGASNRVNGSRVEWTILGEKNGQTNQPVVVGRLERAPAGLALYADGSPVGAAAFDVEVISNRVMISRAIIPGGLLGVIRAEWSEFIRAVWQGPLGPIVDENGNYCSIFAASPLDPGETLEIRYRPTGMTVTVGKFSTVHLRGVNSGDFTLRDEAVAHLGQWHRGVGSGLLDTSATNSAPTLRVRNLGSSGEDGVETFASGIIAFDTWDNDEGVSLPTRIVQSWPDDWEMPWLTSSNGYVSWRATGHVQGSSNAFENLSDLSAFNGEQGTMDLFARFDTLGATQALVEVFNGPTLVGSVTLPVGGLGTIGAASVRRVIAQAMDNALVWIMTGAEPWNFLPANGAPVLNGDRLRISSLNPQKSVDGLHSLITRGANVQSFAWNRFNTAVPQQPRLNMPRPMTGGQLTFSLSAEPDVSYDLERGVTIQGPWTNVGRAMGTDGTNKTSFFDIFVGDEAFYRIRVR